MRLFLLSLSICSALAIPTVDNSFGYGLVDSQKWAVESESDDHITYIRRPPPNTQLKSGHESGSTSGSGQHVLGQLGQLGQNGVECNQTTTQAPTTTRSRGSSGRRSGSSSSGSGKELRSGGSRSSTSSTSASSSQSTATNTDAGNDYWWMVSHKTDDHITYRRRNSSSSSTTTTNNLDQGQLRQLGSGQDSVLARVVLSSDDTEEGLLTQGQRQGQSSSSYSGKGYPTNELVHPYVKKTKEHPKNHSNKTKSGGRKSHNIRRGQNQLRSGIESIPTTTPTTTTTTAPPTDDTPPRVGEELNGWVVVSKSKDHISWARAGSASTTASGSNNAGLNAGAVSASSSRSASSLSRRQGQDERLKSLKTSSRRPSKLIPSAEGELIEGFPRVFNTYSRAHFSNESNIDESNVATIRTSLSNSTNWKIGDELAGWKVITKDHRGIVWEKIKTDDKDANANNNANNGELNEEDLLNQLNGGNNGESDSSSSSSESGEGNGEGIYRGPPGTWYLAKETQNSITWQRDNVPEDVVFEMDAFPRINDIQSGWKVSSKSKEHISWVRINSDGSLVESEEQAN